MMAERGALALFLALLVCAPFPPGSNRAWAWTLLELGFLLAIALWTTGWLQRRHGSRQLLRAARPAFALLDLWLAWLALQCLPPPAGLVRALSPQAAVHALSAPDATTSAPDCWVTLSVDPYASIVFWLKSCAYACAFFLTLAYALVLAVFTLARGFAFAVLMGVCAIGIHGAVDLNLQIPANALAFMVLIAYGWVTYSPDSSEKGASH